MPRPAVLSTPPAKLLLARDSPAQTARQLQPLKDPTKAEPVLPSRTTCRASHAVADHYRAKWSVATECGLPPPDPCTRWKYKPAPHPETAAPDRFPVGRCPPADSTVHGNPAAPSCCPCACSPSPARRRSPVFARESRRSVLQSGLAQAAGKSDASAQASPVARSPLPSAHTSN